MAYRYLGLTMVLLFVESAVSRVYVVEPSYGLRTNRDDPGRQKRQSHPAATVARYPETPAVSGPGQPFRDDHQALVDYLTPPQPPEPLDQADRDFGPGPPSPEAVPSPAGSPTSQQALDFKWDLGYDADLLLIPPIDPYLFGPDTKYNTIQDARKPQSTATQSSNENSSNPKPSSFEDFNLSFAKDPFFQNDDTSAPAKQPGNDFQNPLNFDDSDSKFRPFVPGSNFRSDNLNADLQAPLEKRQTHKKRQSTYEDEDEDHGGEEADDEDHQQHKKPAGPVYTFVKTDKHGHYKWGVRHGVGH